MMYTSFTPCVHHNVHVFIPHLPPPSPSFPQLPQASFLSLWCVSVTKHRAPEGSSTKAITVMPRNAILEHTQNTICTYDSHVRQSCTTVMYDSHAHIHVGYDGYQIVLT